jgi:hypothetical protein
MPEERRVGMNELVQRFEALETKVETLRVSREARLQNIEHHLERLVLLFAAFMRFAPWAALVLLLLEGLTLWVGFEGWRRP